MKSMIALKHSIFRLLLGCTVMVSVQEYAAAESHRDFLIDASLHYILSAEITFASCMFMTLKNPDISLKNKYLLGAGIGTFSGISKELLDIYHTTGSFDYRDIGINLLGVGTGLFLHFLIFDRKMLKGNISLNLSQSGCLASIQVCF